MNAERDGRKLVPPFEVVLEKWPLRQQNNLRRALQKLSEIGAFDVLQDAALLSENGVIQGIRVTGMAGKAFLGGTWLEAAIYSRLAEKLRGRNEVELAAGVRLPAGNTADSGEIDLVLLKDDRLHIVEIKAVTTAKGMHAQLDKLALRRTNLSGPTGPAWMIAPLLDDGIVAEAGLTEMAITASVNFKFGVGAVDAFVNEIMQSLL